MKKYINPTLASMATIIFLSGCENASDKERKASVAQNILDISLSQCDPQNNFSSTDSYETRLREVLMNTRTTALDYLVENEITVCLDQRLAAYDASFLERRAYAFYYPEEKSLSLFDNGNSSSTKAFLETSATSYGDNLLERFASKDTAQAGEIQYGYTYTVNTGKTTTTRYYKWKDANGFKMFESDSNLSNPPLRPQ